MKYSAKYCEENFNVPKQSYLLEFIKNIFILTLFVAASFYLLDSTIRYCAPLIPMEHEHYLSKFFNNHTQECSEYEEQERYLQVIVSKMAKYKAIPNDLLKVKIIKSDLDNAFAVPGGTIVITSELIKNATTENELVFVLGHEVAHFINRDHLRNISLSILIGAFFAAGGGDVELLSKLSELTKLTLSREAESLADKIALELLNQHYSHVGGATSFFERMSKLDHENLSSYFSTHPLSIKRIQNLNDLIIKKSFIQNDTTPAPTLFSNLSSAGCSK